jgi:hypothetical protein
MSRRSDALCRGLNRSDSGKTYQPGKRFHTHVVAETDNYMLLISASAVPMSRRSVPVSVQIGPKSHQIGSMPLQTDRNRIKLDRCRSGRIEFAPNWIDAAPDGSKSHQIGSMPLRTDRNRFKLDRCRSKLDRCRSKLGSGSVWMASCNRRMVSDGALYLPSTSMERAGGDGEMRSRAA